MSGIDVVPLQRLPFDSPNVISPEKAAVRCADLGVESLLQELNALERTSLPLENPGLVSLLQSFISHDYDLGTVYAQLRSIWSGNSEDIRQDFVSREAVGTSYEQRRQSSISGNIINNPYTINPRRLWDLYAHRVIPYHVASSGILQPIYWAVSHSWTDDMSAIESPVNAYEWPIPLPTGITLEAVRTELLHLGVEYVWLDVLCLRQKSTTPGEAHRQQEWAIDVPTIGNVYTDGAFRVVRYFNGLGRAFSGNGWNGSRHWLNRVWTLQEIKFETVDAGLPAGIKNLRDERSYEDGTVLSDRLLLLQELEVSAGEFVDERHFIRIIEAMRTRYSTNPVDKVAGIGMLLRCPKLPIYREAQSPEEAFRLCVQQMHLMLQGRLLFCFPTPGDGDCAWRPSWNQLMSGENLTPPMTSFPPIVNIVGLAGNGHAYYRVPVISACFVSPPNAVPDRIYQRASIVVDTAGGKEEYSVSVRRDALISEGSCVLVGEQGMESWVVCRKVSLGLRKVSILLMDDVEATRMKSARLCVTRRCTFV